MRSSRGSAPAEGTCVLSERLQGEGNGVVQHALVIKVSMLRSSRYAGTSAEHGKLRCWQRCHRHCHTTLQGRHKHPTCRRLTLCIVQGCSGQGAPSWAVSLWAVCGPQCEICTVGAFGAAGTHHGLSLHERPGPQISQGHSSVGRSEIAQDVWTGRSNHRCMAEEST